MNIPLYINGIISGQSLPKTPADKTTLDKAFLIFFAIVGAMAILIVVLAGLRYIFAKGEPDNIQKARNELKYAIIGLIFIAIATALVNFVIGFL